MRRLVLALVLSGLAGSASAGLTSTVTFASDYLFDGFSLNQGDGDDPFNPVVQASLDYAHDSGFYVGTWASPLDLGSASSADWELDFYGGYAGQFGDWGYDTGFAHYLTPSTNPSTDGYDYTEYYFGVTSPGGTSLKAWLAEDHGSLGGFAYRVKLKHSFALPDDYSFQVEATQTNYANPGFTDISHGQFGFAKTFGRFNTYLGYATTSNHDVEAGEGRVLLTVATTFELL